MTLRLDLHQRPARGLESGYTPAALLLSYGGVETDNIFPPHAYGMSQSHRQTLYRYHITVAYRLSIGKIRYSITTRYDHVNTPKYNDGIFRYPFILLIPITPQMAANGKA